MVANLILLCSLKTYLSFKTWKYFCKRIGAILFISLFFFFFSGGHLSTHCFKYLGHLSIFSQFFFLFFMNNFCIAPCLFSATKLLRDSKQKLRAFIWSGNLTRIFLVFSSSVGVKHSWVDLDGRHISAPTPNVGVVHM